MTKPATIAKNKYNAKGEKDKIKDHAQSKGESLNGFINRAIHETMSRDKTE